MSSVVICFLASVSFIFGVESVNTQPKLPVFISTWPIGVGAAERGYHLHVNQSRSIMDSIELGISEECELRSCSRSVGAYGKVDEKGKSSLDAMIMDGKTLRVGAVGNVKTVKNVISLARAVIRHTTSTFLAGEDVTEFAVHMGFQLSNLTNNYTDYIYNRWKVNRTCQPNFRQNVSPDPKQNCGPYTPLEPRNYSDTDTYIQDEPQIDDDELWMHGVSGMINSPEEDPDHDTICMLGIDQQRNLVAGVSTNGLNYKIPGRVGDSPVAGAGGYADNEAGAAAATGNGDIMLRFLPSYQAVESMRNGLSAKKAAEYAIWRIARKEAIFRGALITLSSTGEYGAACFGYGTFAYGVRTANMTEAQLERVRCIRLDTYSTPAPPTVTVPSCPTPTSDAVEFKKQSISLYILLSFVIIGQIYYRNM